MPRLGSQYRFAFLSPKLTNFRMCVYIPACGEKPQYEILEREGVKFSQATCEVRYNGTVERYIFLLTLLKGFAKGGYNHLAKAAKP